MHRMYGGFPKQRNFMNVTSTFSQLSKGGLNPVGTINELINSFLPSNPLLVVLGISILIAYRVKRQTNSGIIPFIIYAFAFWSALRYWGIGGG